MNRVKVIVIFCLFFSCHGNLLFAQQQDSLLGDASIRETYRSISMEKKTKEKDKEFIEPLEVETIQKEVLEEGQVLLEYFISEEKICVFIISKNDFQKQIIARDFPLEDWSNLLINSLLNPNFVGPDFERRNEAFVEKSNLLFEKIFAPLEKFNLPERLLIKPDGVLKKLPFEVFLTAPPKDLLDYENHDYLFKKYKISYCHSTTQQQKTQVKRETAPKLFMTFAPTETTDLQREATAIYQKFGGDIYRNQRATKAVLKTEAPLFQAIHFPEICEKELVDLPKLNAEMVVFSGCENKGNHLALVSQLIEKGTKSVVTNLWKTTPENKLDFLKYFYHYIYQKKDKDAALQRAKLDALRWTSGVEGHPHFWANYLVFGVVEGVDLQGVRFDLWLWGGLVLMLIFGVFFINKNII